MCAANLSNDRSGVGSATAALAWLLRLVLLYPLTVLCGAVLLWIGMELVSADAAASSPAIPPSQHGRSASEILLISEPRSDAARPERTRPERSKPERSKPERTKPERTKPERTKPERSKPERTRPERSKPERTRSETSRRDTPSAAGTTGGGPARSRQAVAEPTRGRLDSPANGRSGRDGRGHESTKQREQTKRSEDRMTAAVTGRPAPSRSTAPASRAGCTTGAGGRTCTVSVGTGQDRKVETCTRKNGKGCEAGLHVSTAAGNGQLGARVYFKPNGDLVARTRETTSTGSTTATSVGRGNTGSLSSGVGAGSRCSTTDTNRCHTKNKTMTAAGTPDATAVAGMATCGRLGGGSCTAQIAPAGDPSCTTSGPGCRSQVTTTSVGTGDIATSAARCARHKAGSCAATTQLSSMDSVCTGTGGHTFCRTEAVSPAGATTGACRQTDSRCGSTSQLNRPGGPEPGSVCTSGGLASSCDTRAAALGGTPVVGYCVSLLGGANCDSSASVRRGATCEAGGAMIHCSSTAPRNADADTSCDRSGGARCREEFDRAAGTLTAGCTAVSAAKARCKTRSSGESVAPLDPPPGEPLPLTMADVAAAADPAVLTAARGRSGRPLTVEQAQAQVRRLQDASARAAERLDRLAPQGQAINAFADAINAKRGVTPTQLGAFDAFYADHERKVERQLRNEDTAMRALRKVDVALAAESGRPAWAVQVKTAAAQVDEALTALRATPDRQIKTMAKRAKAYQQAQRNYAKVITSAEGLPGSALTGYRLPSTGAGDVFTPMTAAGRLADYQSYRGPFEDYFRGLTPDQLAQQAAYEPVEEAVAALAREQAEADAREAAGTESRAGLDDGQRQVAERADE